MFIYQQTQHYRTPSSLTQVQTPCLTHTTSKGAGIFSQLAHSSHQVHGGTAWRMWLNKQLRWRLSKALDLCLCGLREREWEEGERESEAVTINMHQSDGSMRYLTMQANPNSAMPLRKGGGKEKGVQSQSAWVLPLPPSLQSHPSVSMEETSLFLLTCFS